MTKGFSRNLPLLAGAALGLLLAACSASTAHISSFGTFSDKDHSTAATTFGAHDTVYASAQAANLPNKVTLQFATMAENVKGMAPNKAIPALDKSFDLASDGSATYDLTPPTAGWPDGTYKITVTMMDGGTARDTKSVEFTVGTPPAAPAGGADNSTSGADNTSNGSQ